MKIISKRNEKIIWRRDRDKRRSKNCLLCYKGVFWIFNMIWRTLVCILYIYIVILWLKCPLNNDGCPIHAVQKSLFPLRSISNVFTGPFFTWLPADYLSFFCFLRIFLPHIVNKRSKCFNWPSPNFHIFLIIHCKISLSSYGICFEGKTRTSVLLYFVSQSWPMLSVGRRKNKSFYQELSMYV